MSQDDMITYGIALLAFIAVAGVGIALTSGGGEEAAKKRAKLVASGETGSKVRQRNRADEESHARKRETQKMLAKLREDGEKRRADSTANDLKSKIAQAGLSMSESSFWVMSAICGVVLAGLVFMSGAEGLTIGGVEYKSQVIVVIAAGVSGFLGLPRWFLGFLAGRRAKKMTNQFADAIDIIVRGVRSGLPLIECLRIIARESPAPLGPEFERLTDNLAMGGNLDRALQAFYKRVPLPEINFFVIVLSIQSKSGGNLSEALGNLSTVIRSRRMMREKVKALSSEAKASAMIIGALPFVVGTMVYMTSRDYVMLLFTTETGHLQLTIGAGLLLLGITVMRKMINFDM
ncbi:MAG: type II secretion system F family protein [Pseudomonadota bacterium]